MQLVATLAVVVSVLVLAYQGRELAGNTRVANEVAGTQAHRELLLHYKAVTDAFIRYPELDAYFFDKTTETPSAHDSVRLSFVADQYADWLHAGFVTSQRLASYAHWGEEWTSYIPQALTSSSWLRATIRDNPGVYPSVEPFVADYDASHEYGPDRPTLAPAPTAIAPRHLAQRFIGVSTPATSTLCCQCSPTILRPSTQGWERFTGTTRSGSTSRHSSAPSQTPES